MSCARVSDLRPVGHHLTTYGDQMVAVSDGHGNLVAIMNGPRAVLHARVFCDLPSLLEELEAALSLATEDDRYSRDLAAAAHRLLLLANVFQGEN